MFYNIRVLKLHDIYTLEIPFVHILKYKNELENNNNNEHIEQIEKVIIQPIIECHCVYFVYVLL